MHSTIIKFSLLKLVYNLLNSSLLLLLLLHFNQPNIQPWLSRLTKRVLNWNLSNAPIFKNLSMQVNNKPFGKTRQLQKELQDNEGFERLVAGDLCQLISKTRLPTSNCCISTLWIIWQFTPIKSTSQYAIPISPQKDS